jgi:anti-sigma factor RsiW
MARPHDPEHSELTALADGTLSGRRRRRLEERLERERGLREELERQRHAVAALRAADLAAPAGLRTRIEAERERARGPARRRRLAVGGTLAGAVAAGALALVLVLPDGAGAPSVVEAAELAERPSAGPPPRPGHPDRLAVAAFGLPFPDWAQEFGWSAIGARRDEIDGRDAVTVFYEKEGRRIAYTVVSGDRIDPPDHAASAERAGTRLSYLEDRGRLVVTWERRGFTCLLSGRGVPRDVLLDLAGWRAMGKIPF